MYPLPRPTGGSLGLRRVIAGFVVALAGNIMTMPGLPRHPAAENIDIAGDGRITGLF